MIRRASMSDLAVCLYGPPRASGRPPRAHGSPVASLRSATPSSFALSLATDHSGLPACGSGRAAGLKCMCPRRQRVSAGGCAA